MASSSSYNSPCAACKFLRRKCIPGCVFSPYFPPEDPQKFVNVHKIFGASNVTKLLNDVLPHQREDAVSSLAYEAEARVRDPVYGCVGVITVLQRQLDRLQMDLDAANAELMRHVCNGMPVMTQLSSIQPVTPPQRSTDHFCARRITGGGFYQPLTSFPYYYVNRTLNWKSYANSSENMSGEGGGGCGGGGVGNM
ncbi:hypothetical protein L1987_48124 [Smallanthus sonchifolius]|uniref:Uncharacterized protein n=1 Tax=Smallanthus sonchifolius TaxID=185202 RepID=A0ACB9FQS0_9ASTR|nr:hypothetical protein L1987_48124 [Smallanthus sonchifolius]